MIIGKTNEQRAKAQQEELFRLGSGVKRFAFLPVKLDDGRRVWLRSYWEYLMVDREPYLHAIKLHAPRMKSIREYRRTLVEDWLGVASAAIKAYAIELEKKAKQG